MLDLFIDIDHCPVYPQMLRTAQRHSLELYVVTRDYVNADANVHLIFAQEDGVAAREWIAANISRGDICVTEDTALAASCLLRGAIALASTGWAWTSEALLAADALPVSDGGRAARRLPGSPTGDPRIFAQRLDATIAAVRSAEPRPPVRPPGFGRAGTRLVTPARLPSAAAG